MKKYRILAAFIAGGLLFGSASQGELAAQSVSTQPKKKAVLLEEYTGTGCGNCPDGARRAAILKEAHGSQFYTIAIHEGHYAEPSGNRPDYRTDFGAALLAEATDIGFPAGAINRYPYVDGILNMSRAYWIKSTKQASAESAPVNLYMEASVDAQSRELTVKVEMYYTQDPEEERHFLHVALLQNHVIGYQNGGGAQYSHEHMLRHLLTGQWGDTIGDLKKGEVMVRTYTYTLPESIREVELDIRNLELVAFMTRTKQDVLNVTGCKPRIDGLEEALAVDMQAVALPSSRYGYTFIPVSIRNKCNDTLRRMTFAIDINGSTETVVSKDEVLPYATQTVEIPTGAYEILASNEVTVKMTGTNGQSLETAGVKYTFSEPMPIASRTIYLELKTDLWGDEVTYCVRNRDGNRVYDNGPFEAEVQTTVYDTIVLDEDGVYALEFNDKWYDGWMESPKGSYKIRGGDGKLIGQNYSVEGKGDVIFIRVTEEAGSEETASVMGTLQVVNGDGGFRVLNPAGLKIEKVDVYSVNGSLLHTAKLRAEGDVFVPFATTSTRICLVGVKTISGTKYFKVLQIVR